MKVIRILVVFILCLLKYVYAKWIFNMENFESCKGHEKAPQVFNNSHISMNSGIMSVNYDVYISRDITNSIESQWIIEKCKSRENLNSCMSFYNFKTSKMCDMINSKGEMWTAFVECIQPHYGCPFKKGVYKARDCTLDISLLTLMPIQPGYWRCKILMTDRKKKSLGCLSVEGEIRRSLGF